MIFVSDDKQTKLSPSQFRQMFGKTWADVKKDDHKLKDIGFKSAYCAIDPYDQDILSEINPIISDCLVELNDMVDFAAEEI